MIKKIAHFADIHIRKNPKRNPEYQQVFNDTIISLKKEKPDLIVIVGDLFHDYIDFQSETILMASNFLKDLSKISPVYITQGNHDKALKDGDKRMDAIRAIVDTLSMKEIVYLDKTEFVDVENITFAVWHHEDKTNPYVKYPEYVKKEGQVLIDLFHDPIFNCMSDDGMIFNQPYRVKIEEFKGDISLFGDIHRRQFFSSTKAYSGSLVQQNFGENVEKHGYLLWDVENLEAKEIDIKNDVVREKITIKENTDYDNLTFIPQFKAKTHLIRLYWMDYGFNRTTQNEIKLKNYLKDLGYNQVEVEKPNRSNKKIKSKNNLSSETFDINNEEHLKEKYKEYLKKDGYTDEIIQKVIDLDTVIGNRLTSKRGFGVKEFKLNSILIDNFQQYGDNVFIDFSKEGLIQIIGKNQIGKSTILDAITYSIYGKTLNTLTKEKDGDKRYINNRRDRTDCKVVLNIFINDDEYEFIRETVLHDDKVSTSLVINNKSENNNPLNKNSKRETQTFIDSLFGSFDDFILLHLTNANNLDKILSVDRREFLDSLSKNMGLGIFDEKLEEYKEYKKEFKDLVINLNPEKEETDISNLENSNFQLSDDISSIEKSLFSLNKEVTLKTKEKENLFYQLKSISSEFENFDISKTFQLKSGYEKEITDFKISIENLNKSISLLPKEYDKEALENVKKLLQQERVENNQRSSLKMTLNDKLSTEKAALKYYQSKISDFDKKIAELREEYKIVSESNKCNACGQDINTDEHKQHIANKQNELKNKAEKVKAEKNENEGKISNQSILISNTENELSTLEAEILLKTSKQENILIEIATLEYQEKKVQERKLSEQSILVFESKIKANEEKIKNIDDSIIKYEQNKRFIEENLIIKQQIKDLDTFITQKNEEINKFTLLLNTKKIDIAKNTENIKTKREMLVKYYKYKEQELIEKIYTKMINREGLPIDILKGYIPVLNDFLDSLLFETNFKLKIDENIKLKIIKGDGSSQDVLQGSGMEKSFIAFVFKIAMIQTNTQNRFDFIMLDEIMDRLDIDNLEIFIEVLNKTKNWISKIIVINHLHNIYPDYIIEPYKNEEGVTYIKN